MNRLITFIIILALFSCNNDEPALNPEPQPEKHYSLVGEWEWIGSYCGWNVSHTPEETESSLTLAFNRNGNFFFMENNDTILKTSYIVRRELNNMFNEENDAIYINCDSVYSFQEGVFFVAPGFNCFIIRHLTDTLYFAEADVCDGCGHSFKRKQNNHE